MRINIFTLSGYFNYGNRLQLFVLNRVLENMIGRKAKIKAYRKKRLRSRFKDFVEYRTPLKIKFQKESKLYRFTKKCIVSETNNAKCDYAVFGSDQIWNPDFFKNKPWLLGDGVDGRKIAYAASIGRDELSKEQLKMFEQKLKSFKAISVREKAAQKLLQPLTNKPVEVVLDPTLLLDAKEYEILEKKPKNITEGEKYILCYILGEREYIKAIENFAQEHNCRIILFSDQKESSYGVEEFLYLIHHAELICTDSFHACVFSFIFERPFVAFRRSGKHNDMYSRLQNLIDTFKLKNREFNGKEITKENLTVDYTEAKKILMKERQKSLEFLTKALGVKNES